MGLIAGDSPGAHLLHAHHHLHNIQMIDHFCHLRGCDTGNDLQDLFAGNVDINDLSGNLQRGDRHGRFRPVRADRVVRNELIQEIKVFSPFSVQLHDNSVFYFQ